VATGLTSGGPGVPAETATFDRIQAICP
jgi:hypothetical protein